MLTDQVGDHPAITRVVASTGIDLATLEHPEEGRYIFRLNEGIADDEMSISVAGAPGSTGPVTPTVVVWKREPDDERRTFAIHTFDAVLPAQPADRPFSIQFWRIANPIPPAAFPRL